MRPAPADRGRCSSRRSAPAGRWRWSSRRAAPASRGLCRSRRAAPDSRGRCRSRRAAPASRGICRSSRRSAPASRGRCRSRRPAPANRGSCRSRRPAPAIRGRCISKRPAPVNWGRCSSRRSAPASRGRCRCTLSASARWGVGAAGDPHPLTGGVVAACDPPPLTRGVASEGAQFPLAWDVEAEDAPLMGFLQVLAAPYPPGVAQPASIPEQLVGGGCDVRRIRIRCRRRFRVPGADSAPDFRELSRKAYRIECARRIRGRLGVSYVQTHALIRSECVAVVGGRRDFRRACAFCKMRFRVPKGAPDCLKSTTCRADAPRVGMCKNLAPIQAPKSPRARIHNRHYFFARPQKPAFRSYLLYARRLQGCRVDTVG